MTIILFLFGRKRIKAQMKKLQDRAIRSRVPLAYNIEPIHQAMANEGTNDRRFSDPSNDQTNAWIFRSDKLFQKIIPL